MVIRGRAGSMTRILFFIILIGLAVWYYRRWTASVAQRKAVNAHRRSGRDSDAVTTLVKDPKTGEYRVKQDD
ncbi:conserved hypothetical protein [Allorhizobium ampelinum S4]|uniref:Uncharacterized protein n=2 Tax=Rhizobium/Agrobacterium group TaxID=227290 RepID=B9JSH3_ALLAM|nr:conserved hypothetical protein [Allorhizobium ampelinum S4]